MPFGKGLLNFISKLHENQPKFNKNTTWIILTKIRIQFDTNMMIPTSSTTLLLPTFWDWILVEQAKPFNLSHRTVTRSNSLEKYYVITKKLRRKSKIYDRKMIFSNFENMFLEHFYEVFNLQQMFSWYFGVFWKP